MPLCRYGQQSLISHDITRKEIAAANFPHLPKASFLVPAEQSCGDFFFSEMPAKIPHLDKSKIMIYNSTVLKFRIKQISQIAVVAFCAFAPHREIKSAYLGSYIFCWILLLSFQPFDIFRRKSAFLLLSLSAARQKSPAAREAVCSVPPVYLPSITGQLPHLFCPAHIPCTVQKAWEPNKDFPCFSKQLTGLSFNFSR